MNWDEKILTQLVESYRKSKKDSGDNIINRRTQIKPEKLYKKYDANDGDYSKIEEINKTVNELKERNFIDFEKENFGTQIKSIYLIDESIEKVENYLKENYGYISKKTKQDKVIKIIEEYQNASPICNLECNRLKSIINQNKVPDKFELIPDILKAVAFIENNINDLYVRELSMKIYGDSKYFEEKTLDMVCKMILKYSNKEIGENQILDEILEKYHIFKEPQKLSVKGNMKMVLSKKTVDLSGFNTGIEFDTGIISNIDSIHINASKFITVENRTSYLRYNDSDAVILYLGGYANRFQRDFINMIYKDNPDIEYMHFGDIDAGGFWIHHDLCEKTGIKFNLLHMSEKELKEDKYKSCLHKLSENDIIRLKELVKIPEYADTIKYMLNHNVKLEQEIISMELMGV